MYAWREEWMSSEPEAVIDPGRPIIDPHHHLWDSSSRMPQYLVDELHGDTGSGHHVVGTVFVECAWSYFPDGPEPLRPVGETVAVAAAAKQSASGGAEILGIISFADLTLGDAVDEVLEAHITAGEGRFRGIRHATAHDPDERIRRTHTKPTPQMMGDDSFRRGVRRLAAKGLSFEAWLYHPQIPELAALARAVPECTFVLDHLGGPLGVGPYAGHRDEIMAQWRIDIADVATCANVNLKLGGIGMSVYGLGFEDAPHPPSSDDLVAAWGEPISFAIEQFGVDRCMYESNFPVDRVSTSYATLWNAFKKISASASSSEQDALFHDTAMRVYRL